MGISEGFEEGAGIDCSVGAIVWVRRRNGSWWPGRILGPDELSESHLLSPRSGTPVKLLGREDASVDWYNLEKSKRVKAFRSGEFDDCIIRAESAQGAPIKKREKYARRDDAILHALELERLYLEKRQQKPGMGPNCMSNRMPDISNKELGICSPSKNFLGNDKARGHYRFINLKSQTLCKKPDSSEVESTANLLYVPKGEHAKPSWEDDSSEALPRMRGLQDLGLRIAPSKRKTSASIACRTSGKPVSVDSHLCVLSSVGNGISSIKNSMSFKRNRSQRGMNEDSLVRRRDRRRPIVQVLQTSAKLPVCQPLQSDGDAMSMTLQGRKERGMRSPSYQMQMSPTHFGMNSSLFHPSSLTEECTSSRWIEAQESDSFEGDYLDPDTEEEEALISDPTNLGRHICCGGSVYQVPVQAGNMDNEDLDESELSSYESQHHHDEQTGGNSSDMSGSKWQLKGKRNIRNVMKRPIELVDGKDSVIFDNRCNGAIQESLCEGKGNIVSTARMMNRLRLLVQQRSEDFSYTYDEDDLIENDLGQIQTSGFGNRKYPSILKASSIDRGISNNNFISSDEDSLVMSPSMWEADRLSQATLKGYWKESDGWFNPTYISNFGDQMGSILVDVDLKVQASYKGEHVPLVSLMSRLNGKAIVGHPVQVEKLEDGSSDLLVCRDDFCEELPDDYEKTALPPVWRTARRTTMHRVPRPPPSPALERGEASFVLYSHPFKKPYAGHIKNKVIKRTLHHIRHPPSQKNFSKKLLRKVSSPSLKTRTLSSIAIEQRCSSKTGDSKQADKNVELYGLIKLEGTVPLMTCVPVKLAFSRILEAIGRPPSISGNRRGFQQIIGS